MCGVCGVVDARERPRDEVIDAQLRVQHHRGPDASGAFARGCGAIAQNRLSIIDLEHGDPPITTEDGAIGVVLNGEIYNFRELQGELEHAGHRLASRCDTEVIAHLAEGLGAVELARRLDGMFAFAVWDSRRERLVLGRDRLGKKPLHYWFAEGRLVFASEIKGVLAHPAVPRRLHPRAIPAYLTFGYVPTPGTFYDGIRSLPPGHVLTLERGGEPRIERYWEPPRRHPGPGPSLETAAAEVRSRFEAAVRRRLIADVPLGAFLSGGIDSSAVVAMMAAASEEPVATFTIGFEDRDGYDERPYARMVARRYRTDHHEFVVHPNAVDLLETVVAHQDQPFADSSNIPTYLLNEQMRGHVTVVLSGDGGDELFAGYPRFPASLAIGPYRRLPGALRALVRGALGLVPGDALSGRVGKLQRNALVAELGLPEAYLHWVSTIDEPNRVALLRDADPWAREQYFAAWRATEGAEVLDRLLDLNLRTYLLDDLLVKADRMSMAHGLEVRSPFLDVDLVTYAIGLPPHLKVRGRSTKRVLKHALRNDLPPEILRRRKRGFGVPLDRWFREDLRTYVDQMLGSPSSRLREHLRGEAIDALIAQHLAREHKLGEELWTLLTLEVFLRREGW